MLIKMFDILGGIGIALSLNLVVKRYKFWIMYVIATVLFLVVVAYKGLPGLFIMGICTLIAGIRNYRSEKKKVN